MQQGQFYLDDQPQLIQAGEFHYFRTPVKDWEHRLNLLIQAGFNTVASYIPWRWHQLSENTFDLDGHSHDMRNLEGFLKLAKQMGLWVIARPGPYIMAETTHEGIPDWIFETYPQVALIDQQQKVHNLASYLHPDFLFCVRKWYQAVFQVLGPHQISQGGNIIMVQLDNEMGMPHWVRNVFDLNPDTLHRFAHYLHKERLSARYPTQNLTDFLQEALRQPSEVWSTQIAEDYRHFYRNYLRDYTDFLLGEARANGLNTLAVINIHGFANGGKTFPIGLSQLREVLALDLVSATDVYPLAIHEGNIHELLLVNAMTKALQNSEQPLFSIEFQAGGNADFGNGQTSLYDLHSRLCLSQGMRAFNHYLFFDGENHPLLSPVKRHDWGHPVRKDGSLRKHYHRYPELSKVLAAYGQDFIVSQTQTTSAIGFVLDYFMTEVNHAYTQQSTKLLTEQRECILFDFIARGLTLTHRPFKAIDLAKAALHPQQTPHCWVMLEQQCPSSIQQKLVEYARNGGNLILVGRLCTKDFNHQPCTLLQEALGVSPLETELGQNIQAFNHQDVPTLRIESYLGDVDEVFATQKGRTVGFIKAIGKGKVMMLGASMTANTLEDVDIVQQMALKMQCQSLFTCDPWVDVRLSCGEKGNFLFVNNYQDDPVSTVLHYQDSLLFGGNPIHLPARSGQILPLEWQLNKYIKLHYLTSEITDIKQHPTEWVIQTRQSQARAEISLSGYHCPEASLLETSAAFQRVQIATHNGIIRLRKT